MKIFVLLFLLFAIDYANGQANYFELNYGLGTGVSIEKALNGNIIIGANKGIDPNYQGYSLLINTDGDTLSTITFPNNTIKYIRETADSSFVLVGDSCCPIIAGLYKTNKFGNLLWKTNYPTNGWSTYGNSVIAVANGYFVTYLDDAFGSANPLYVVQADSLGYTIANRPLTIPIGTTSDLQITSDNNLIIASQNYALEAIFLTKLNLNDSIIWSKQFRDMTFTIGWGSNSVIQTNDGGYMVAGFLDTYGSNYPTRGLLLKTDSLGDSLWTRDYSIPNSNLNFISLKENGSGQLYIAASFQLNSSANLSTALIKTEANGDTIWIKHFSGLGRSLPTGMILDDNENPMIIGSTWDTLTNLSYIYLIKTDTSGNITTSNVEIKTVKDDLYIFPNPVHSTLHIETKKPLLNEYSIVIRNTFGQILFSIKEKRTGDKINETIDFDSFKEGVYFLELSIDGVRSENKIVKN